MTDKSRFLQAVLALALMVSQGRSAYLASFEGFEMSRPQPADSPYNYSIEPDSETGWKVYRLSFRDPKNHDKSVVARIVPEGGSNLIGLEVNGVEFLHTPPKISQSAGVGFGIPILYPTPNRVRNSRFTFDGRTFEFAANNGANFIHGLVNRAVWKAETPRVSRNSVSLRTYLDFNQDFSSFRLFPIQSRIALTFTLASDGILIRFDVENKDSRNLPFGFGLHPYFKILGERSQTFIRVPAESHMEAEGLLPTGKLNRLDGAPFDIRSYTPLEKLRLDDVYWGMAPKKPAGYESRDRGIQVVLEASKIFTHAVVYTPQGRPYFCIENQTCSTDAHNLHAQGLVKEAHLVVLKPGETSTGTVRIRVRPRIARVSF